MKILKKFVAFMLTAMMLFSMSAINTFASSDGIEYTSFLGFDSLDGDFVMNKNSTSKKLTDDVDSDVKHSVSFHSSCTEDNQVIIGSGYGKSDSDKVLVINHKGKEDDDTATHNIQLSTSGKKVAVSSDGYYITSVQYYLDGVSASTYSLLFSEIETITSDNKGTERNSAEIAKINGYTVTIGDESVVKTSPQWITITACVKGGTNSIAVYVDDVYVNTVSGSLDKVCNYVQVAPGTLRFDAKVATEYSAYIDNFCAYLSSDAYDGTDVDTSITSMTDGKVDSSANVISVFNPNNAPVTVAELKGRLGVTEGKLSDGKKVRIYSTAPGTGKTAEAAENAVVTTNTKVYVEAANGIALKEYSVEFYGYEANYDFSNLSDDYSYLATKNDDTTQKITDSTEKSTMTVNFDNITSNNASISVAKGFGKSVNDKVLEVNHLIPTEGSSAYYIQMNQSKATAIDADKYYITSVQYRVSKNSKLKYNLRIAISAETKLATERETLNIATFDGCNVKVGNEDTQLTYSEGEWVTITGCIKGEGTRMNIYIDGKFVGNYDVTVSNVNCKFIRYMPSLIRFDSLSDAPMTAYVDNFLGYISGSPYTGSDADTNISSVTGGSVDNDSRVISMNVVHDDSIKVSDLKTALGVTGGKLSDGKKVRIYSTAPGKGVVTEASDADIVTENTKVYVESVNGNALKAYSVELSPDLSAKKTVTGGKASVTLKTNTAFEGDALVAIYSGNELLEVKIVENADLADGVNDVVNFKTDGTLRVFVWDMDTLKPTSIDIEIIQ